MTIEVSGPFLESHVFSGKRAWVCFVLYNRADDFGECWPSYDTIATSARCDRSTAIREVEWLRQHGIVEVLKGAERPKRASIQCGQANVFRVNLKFAWALGQLIQGIKYAVGPRGNRNRAIRDVAKWADDAIENHGADVVVEAVKIILKDDSYSELLSQIRGGVAPLSPKNHSGVTPPHGVAKNPENAAKGSHDAPPESSEDSTGESSGPAAKPSAGEKGSSGKVVDKALMERIRQSQLKVLVEWAVNGSVERLDAVGFAKIDYGGLSGDHAKAFVLNIDPPAVKQAASWAKWALDIRDGRPNMNQPIQQVRRLLKALAHGLNGPLVEARCNMLIEKGEALKQSYDHGDPDHCTEDQSTEKGVSA